MLAQAPPQANSHQDTRLATFAFLGMFNYRHQWFDANGRVSPGDLADNFAGLFIRGISAQSQGQEADAMKKEHALSATRAKAPTGSGVWRQVAT
ncbi:MAG: hypothetical protein R3E55_13635 [Burkholderiaceae bacterium]